MRGLPAGLTVHWSPVVPVTYSHELGGSRQSRVVILQCQRSGAPVSLGLASGAALPGGSREICLPSGHTWRLPLTPGRVTIAAVSIVTSPLLRPSYFPPGRTL